MSIVIKTEAWNTLLELEKFVESKNTPGSGKRFTLDFLKHIKDTLTSFNKHSLCKYPEFRSLKWNCFFYKDWVIAYNVEIKVIEVKVIIHGSLLNY